MNFFFRQLFEAQIGRIHTMSDMWAIIGSRWDKKRVFNPRMVGSAVAPDGYLFGESDSQQKLVLVNRMCVPNCPHPPGDDFAAVNGRNWVPVTECRKCPHYAKPKRRGRYRFARCTWDAKTEAAAAQQTLSVLGEAIQKASDLLK